MKVCLAIPTYDGRIPAESAVHLAQVAMTLSANKIPINMTWGADSALIDLCRNRLVNRFLKETDADVLFFLDNDIIFKSEDMLRLLYWADKYEVVGATYPVRKDPPKFFVKCKDNVFETNDDGLIEVEGFGAGFLCIRRSVFELLQPFVQEFETEEGDVLRAYFDIRIVNRRYKGEDISFMMRWRNECGGRIFLDPNINLKHVGRKEFDYKLIDYLDKRLERAA